MRKKIYFFILLITILVLLAGGLVCYFVFTTKGSSFIAQMFLSSYVETEGIDVQKVTGNLSQALVFQDIEFDNLEWLPRGSLLKIQRLELSLTSFGLEGLNVKIDNGRLKLSGFETILFYGDCQNGVWDVTVYSSVIGVREILDLFAESAALKNLSGTLRNIDIEIKGSFLEPKLNGTFHIEDLARGGFSMTNCPGTLSLKLKDLKGNLDLYGQIVLASGVVSGPKTAIVNLQESKIQFDGNPKVPSLDFKGTSRVEDIKITITLKGTFDKPDLNLSSQPPMPQERLLAMLATNKSWGSVESALSKGELSTDIAKDFLDYFVFSGLGSKTMQHLGLRDMQIKYNDKAKGIGITKDIADKTAATYSVEQPQGKEEKSNATHRIGGEYKVTESISVGAEKELKQDTKTEQAQDKQQTDDKVMLKFKKEF